MSPSEHEKGAGQEPQHGLPLTAGPHGNNSFGSLSVVVVFPCFLDLLCSQVFFAHSHKVYYALTLYSGCKVREVCHVTVSFSIHSVYVQEFKLSEL